MRTRSLLLLSAALAAGPRPARAAAAPTAPAAPAVIESPRPDDPLAATVHRLPNGLTVYLSPNKGRPRISCRVVVRAGSKHDPADSTGMAHYLEHMLFKGTRRLGTLDYASEKPHLDRIRSLYEDLFGTSDPAERGRLYKEIDGENAAAARFAVPNELDRFYRLIGASGLNAYTSDEETVYVVDIPANRLEAWAAAESERFLAPVFRLFQGELETVYEEKNRSLDNAERALGEELERRLHKVHPYGQQPTIGTVEHLKNPSLAKMYAFYERWYVPNNMAIVLAGDFDREEALRIVSRRFANWEPRPLPELPAWRDPPIERPERYELRFEAEQKLELAWPTAPSSHPDAPALEVLDMLADNSSAGLINLRLNLAQRVKSSGSYPVLRNDAGSWRMWAAAKQGQPLEEAEALLLGVAEALKAGDFSEEDVAAVLTNFETDEKERLESNEARADALARSFAAFEPWERSYKRLERLRAVTREDVVRVARKYLGPGRVTVFRRDGKPDLPKIQKPEFTQLSIDPSRESEFLRELRALPAVPIEPKWLAAGKDYQILPFEGGRLYAAKNPYNDLFQLVFRYDRGWRHERRLCMALRLLGLSGAGPYSPEEFKRRLYALGSTLSYSCGERESEARLTGLDRNLWPTLELMSARFSWPRTSTDTLKKMAEVELGARADEKKNPGSVHQALGQWAARGRESPSLSRLTDAEVRSLDEGALQALQRAAPGWAARVGYVGNRSPSELAQLLRSGRKSAPPPPAAPLRLLRPVAPRVLFAHREMAQSRVGLTVADAPLEPARAADEQFFSEYMGGDMSSVIFQELREARALAYSASGGHSAGARKGDDAQFWGRLGCQADKTPEAARLLLSLFSDFPASPERFAETARSIDESYRTSPVPFRAVPETVMDWEDRGIEGGDPGPARLARARAFTLADLKDFARRFRASAPTLWILGPRDKAGLEALRGLGALEEKPVAELFSP